MTQKKEDHKDIVIVRRFAAPRELVFRCWTDPEQVQGWFAPFGYTVTRSELDARVGGRWKVEYRSDAGATYTEHGEFRRVSAPESLQFTLTQVDGKESGPQTTVTVTFTQLGEETQMTFHQTGFGNAKHRDGNAEGWTECFQQLHAIVGKQQDNRAERELHALFSAWFDASTRKDLDASMAPIASDIVSYEHDAPLQFVGAAAVREVCKRGFELTEGNFRWDVPDLQIIVRGDIAVTWGVNRMREEGKQDDSAVSYSRGTRIFQKIAGQWKLIHQHVSFPYDPETGSVVTDSRP